MSKAITIGALLGLGGALAYSWHLQRKNFPDGVPLGNLWNGAGLWLFGATAAGALAGYGLSR